MIMLPLDKSLSHGVVKYTNDFPCYSDEVMKENYANCEFLVSYNKFKVKHKISILASLLAEIHFTHYLQVTVFLTQFYYLYHS